MSAYPYASDAKIAEALTVLGADAIAPNEQTLLQQLVVAAALGSGGSTTTQPFMLAIKNVTVLTSATPADVATVTLPSWCTRYIVAVTGSRLIAESASGTLAAATFQIRDTASGAGTALISNAAGPASTSASTAVSGAGGSGIPFTGSTLYLHQTTNSANAGVVSMYLLITPLL